MMQLESSTPRHATELIIYQEWQQLSFLFSSFCRMIFSVKCGGPVYAVHVFFIIIFFSQYWWSVTVISHTVASKINTKIGTKMRMILFTLPAWIVKTCPEQFSAPFFLAWSQILVTCYNTFELFNLCYHALNFDNKRNHKSILLIRKVSV